MTLSGYVAIPSFHLGDNSEHVHECSPLLVGISTIIVYIEKMFQIVFSLNVKDNYIFPCLHNIRLSYNMLQCNQNAHVYIKL